MALGGRHTLPGFEHALESLRTDANLMGTLVSRSLANANVGFHQCDDDRCAGVIADDEEIDYLELQIARTGTDILMRYQPLAFDLRNVLATVKLSSHLENLADQAVTIARRVRWLNEDPEDEDKDLIGPIFEQAESALSKVLQAFSAVDSAPAYELRNQMESLAQRCRDLEEHFSDAVAERPLRSRAYVNLIEIVRSLERSAITIKRIAGEVIYMAEAKNVREAENRLAQEE